MVSLIRNRLPDLTPFEGIWDGPRGLENLLETVWNAAPGTLPWHVPADLVQTEEEIRCTLEVPGLEPEDIEVVVENGVLTVSGEKKAEYEQNGKDTAIYHRERRYGRFERRFALPKNVNPNAVNASYDQGVLTIVLPRAEESKPRRVQINATGSAQLQS